MVAHSTYANALVSKGHGNPLWEPDPGEYAPVDLADVGYLYKGAFVKLFNASKERDDWSNRLGLPEGHIPINVGDILRKMPLPKEPKFISSEGVSEKGVGLSITAGVSGQAGGGFNFECAQEQGAVLIMRDVAYRQDALDQKRWLDYFIQHCRSWLAFADSLGRNLCLSDLIFVDGCDKTSEWACGAWSEKSHSARVTFVAGTSGVVEGSASLWGRWESSQSFDENVGPQPLSPEIFPNSIPRVSQPGSMPIDAGHSTHITSFAQPPTPSRRHNQCVFVRGFRMGDRTWFRRRFKTRIDLGDGLKTVRKPWKKEENSPTTRPSPQRQISSSDSRGSPSSQTGASGGCNESTGSDDSDGWLDPENQEFIERDDMFLNLDEPVSPADSMISWILETSAAEVAIVHDDDLVDLLQINANSEVQNFDTWIRQLSPIVYLDGQVGMFAGMYNMRRSPYSGRTKHDLPLVRSKYSCDSPETSVDIPSIHAVERDIGVERELGPLISETNRIPSEDKRNPADARVPPIQSNHATNTSPSSPPLHLKDESKVVDFLSPEKSSASLSVDRRTTLQADSASQSPLSRRKFPRSLSFAVPKVRYPTLPAWLLAQKAISVVPRPKQSDSVEDLNGHQISPPDIFQHVSFGFTTPMMSTTPMRRNWAIPEVITLPFGSSPPFHLQASSWQHLLNLLNKFSATRVEATPQAMISTGEQPRLRTVVQFIKGEFWSSKWYTIIYLTIEQPPSVPNAWKYSHNDVGALPYSYTLAELPALLRNEEDPIFSQFYTVPSTTSTPYLTLPTTFSVISQYLQSALRDSQRKTADSPSGMQRLAHCVHEYYSSENGQDDTAIDNETVSSYAGEERTIFQKILARHNRLVRGIRGTLQGTRKHPQDDITERNYMIKEPENLSKSSFKDA